MPSLVSSRRSAELVVVHVRYTRSGRWVVQPERADAPISSHRDARAAEEAAVAYCREHPPGRVVLMDRYLRPHEISPPER